ncbi:hypothetical protein [Paraurantiacibacter namhicola]|uniref:hypothetical protein n=1 Tax=Paraurantiacibacter namhicola TaxID=645517 RepID=UPI0012EE7ED3|nr:hypothetical protein [Paraurantiacibacter namhicola]
MEQHSPECRILREQLVELEQRLADYHERLETALDHDRQFQLKTSWGIVNAVLGIGAAAIVFLLAGRFGFSGGVWDWVVPAVAFLFYLLGFVYSDKGRLRDNGRLSRLPNWAATESS